MLQRDVEDGFRGRVFAAELALLTLTMAASNYMTGELLDRFHLSPRSVTVGIGILFLIPGLVWFATKRWWDRGARPDSGPRIVTTQKAQRCLDEGESFSICHFSFFICHCLILDRVRLRLDFEG